MSDPTDSLRRYVRAALELQGYKFADARLVEITTQFARIVAIAETIVPMGETFAEQPDLGTAPVFRP